MSLNVKDAGLTEHQNSLNACASEQRLASVERTNPAKCHTETEQDH